MYSKCLLSKLAKSNYSPSRLRGVFWHFYKSNGNHSRPAPAEAVWGMKSLWCASAFRGSPYLVCTCMHPRPSLASTDQKENQEAKAFHMGAAFPCDVRTDVLKDCESLKPGGQREPQSTFDGGGWVLAGCQLQLKREGSSFQRWLPTPDHSQGLGRQHTLHGWALLSALPTRKIHVIKFVSRSWPGTWYMRIHISYSFGLIFTTSLSVTPQSQFNTEIVGIYVERLLSTRASWDVAFSRKSVKSLSDNSASGLIWGRWMSLHLSSKKLIKMTVLIN